MDMFWASLVASVLFASCATVSSDSCAGRCGASLDSSKSCQCNSACERYGDCCSDYYTLCKGGLRFCCRSYIKASCSGRCGAALDSTKPCQCNSACATFGDCCADYQTLCAGGGGNTNPTNPSPTCDISCIADQLWNNDVNKVPVWDYEVNYQGSTTTGSGSDEASFPFFTFVNEIHVFEKPTYKAFLPLLDNYNINIGQVESLTAQEWAEIDAFIDVIIPTEVMTLTYNFLKDNGKVTDVNDFRDVIKELWFNLYSRSSSGPTGGDSSGFEHVIVGELKSSTVSGFHNWIQFYLEEKSGRLDYKGYVSRAEPNMVAARFVWNGLTKAKGSFFVGVSPEFDIAIYSICALMRPNSSCDFTMAGQNIRIQTYDVAHKSGLQVATAYPNF